MTKKLFYWLTLIESTLVPALLIFLFVLETKFGEWGGGPGSFMEAWVLLAALLAIQFIAFMAWSSKKESGAYVSLPVMLGASLLAITVPMNYNPSGYIATVILVLLVGGFSLGCSCYNPEKIGMSKRNVVFLLMFCFVISTGGFFGGLYCLDLLS